MEICNWKAALISVKLCHVFNYEWSGSELCVVFSAMEMSFKSSWLCCKGLAHLNAGCWDILKRCEGRREGQRWGEKRNRVCPAVPHSSALVIMEAPWRMMSEKGPQRVCFCERNGAFKGFSTLRVYEMCVCVCVWTQRVRTASLDSLSLHHSHTHTDHTKKTAWWEVLEKGQRKKVRRGKFWTGRGGEDIFGPGKWGLGCSRFVFFWERLVTLRWAADT